MKKEDMNNIKQMINQGSANPEQPASARVNVDGTTDDELENLNEGEGDDLQAGEEGLEEQGLQGEEEDNEDEEGDGEAAAASADGEGESGEVYSPSELAEAIGWDTEEVYEAVLVPLDDGQEPLPLGELKNQFQDQRRTITDLEQQVEQATQGGAQQNEMAQMSQDMMQLTGYMQSLDRMEQTTNWAELEQDDPTEAVLRRQKIMQARQETVGKMQQVHQRDQAIRADNMTKSKTKMIELIPDWSDAEAKKKDQGAIRSHLKGKYGFNDVEINRIADPRTMAMLKELVDLRAQVSQAKEAVKRVRKAPRMLRNSAGRFQSQDKGKQVQSVVANAKKTGRRGDQLNAAKAIFKQSRSK